MIQQKTINNKFYSERKRVQEIHRVEEKEREKIREREQTAIISFVG